MRAGVILVGSFLFLAGLTVGSVLTGRLDTRDESEAAPVVLRQPGEAMHPRGARAPVTGLPRALAAQPGAAALPNFADVAESSIQAVANISSRQVVRRRSIFGNDPFLRYFFGDSRGLSGYRERPSLGSGVIVRPDGYIVTNAHVVGRETAGITVTLPSNQEHEATLVGRDESTDIALLHIDADGLPTLPCWQQRPEVRCPGARR